MASIISDEKRDCGCGTCSTWAQITEYECGCVLVEIYNDKDPAMVHYVAVKPQKSNRLFEVIGYQGPDRIAFGGTIMEFLIASAT